MLWRTGPSVPSFAVTLGPPYGAGESRCALSGAVITDRAPLELYHYGRPVSAERALSLAPLLVLVRHAVMATRSIVEEFGGMVERRKWGVAGSVDGAWVAGGRWALGGLRLIELGLR